MTLVKTSYNRRSFLKASVLAGGGLMIGFNWFASCTPQSSPTLEIPEEWFNLNAYLKIGENGVVTIMSPNPEIGQNVKTSMPMIVAEELGVDWNQVIVEQAPLSNQFVRQIAGGSQSIRRSWQGLRRAGATARHMLLEEAAEQLGVPITSLSTELGVIKHSESDQSLTYGQVASAAAKRAIPEEVSLKDPKDFTLIGTSRKNVDAKKIVTGTPLYGLDLKKEGMLIAMLAHAPAFGMKLKAFDGEPIKTMPGIVDVFSIETYPEDMETQWCDTDAFKEVVVIVGRSTWEVMKAKRALKIEWEEVTSPEDTSEHLAALAKAVETPSKKPARKDGDVNQAFSQASKIIERSYRAPFLAHNTMEPMNFYAHVTPEKVELEGPIQTPKYLRTSVSRRLGISEDQISIMMTRMGGGFGRRLYGNFGVEAALISQKAQAPIKLVYTREDDMTQGVYRPAYHLKYKAALDEAGNLTAFHVRGAGIHGSPLFANRFPAGTVENYLIENQRVASNISTGAWRAPRSNFTAFAEQAFLDEVAEAAGKDPIEFRLALFERALSSPIGEKNDYDASRYAGVLKLVKEKAQWGNPIPGVSRGVSAYFCHNTYVAQILDLEMHEGQPRIKKVWCAVDCGIVVNPDAARNQIEGGIIDGIGHAMYSGLTFQNGQPEQNNFGAYRLIRHMEAPLEIETFFVQNGIDPTGLGEPSLPPIAAALANAMAQATGTRVYDQPFTGGKQIMEAG